MSQSCLRANFNCKYYISIKQWYQMLIFNSLSIQSSMYSLNFNNIVVLDAGINVLPVQQQANQYLNQCWLTIPKRNHSSLSSMLLCLMIMLGMWSHIHKMILNMDCTVKIMLPNFGPWFLYWNIYFWEYFCKSYPIYQHVPYFLFVLCLFCQSTWILHSITSTTAIMTSHSIHWPAIFVPTLHLLWAAEWLGKYGESIVCCQMELWNILSNM